MLVVFVIWLFDCLFSVEWCLRVKVVLVVMFCGVVGCLLLFKGVWL